jgi:hypothetical protein
MTTTTAVKSAAMTPSQAEPVMLRKRIGSTTFVVNVRFSDKATETMQDKILRLIESEAEKSA